MAFQTIIHVIPGNYGDSPLPQEKLHAYCGVKFAVARALGDLSLYIEDLFHGIDFTETMCPACEAHPDYVLSVLGAV